jgi:hypothetical protein
MRTSTKEFKGPHREPIGAKEKVTDVTLKRSKFCRTEERYERSHMSGCRQAAGDKEQKAAEEKTSKEAETSCRGKSSMEIRQMDTLKRATFLAYYTQQDAFL